MRFQDKAERYFETKSEIFKSFEKHCSFQLLNGMQEENNKRLAILNSESRVFRSLFGPSGSGLEEECRIKVDMKNNAFKKSCFLLDDFGNENDGRNLT